MQPGHILILDRATVLQCAPSVEQAADLIARAFELADEGAVDQPLKPYVRPGGRDGEREHGRLITMPAYVGGELDTLGLKAVTSVWTNAERRGIPRASAVTLLFDRETGRPTAMLEGAHLSALRTGAAALFAIHKLRNPGPLRVGLLGAGVIGREVAKAVSSLDGIEEMAIFDVHAPAAEALCATIGSTSGIATRAVKRPDDAVQGAGAVIAATTAPGPYLQAAWFARGSVFVALSLVDADPEYMALADRLVVDDWDQSCREGKPLERMAQLGRIRREQAFTFRDLAVGRPVRGAVHERIYVNPMGVAIEDLVVARATVDEARRRGVGLELSWP